MARPVDNFNDNSLDTTVNWAASLVIPIAYGPTGPNFPAGGSVSETNQRLELSPNAGVAGLSSLDTAINDSNTDVLFKLTDLDVGNMANGDRLLFGYERSDASRYAMFELAMAGGVVAGEWLYLGRSGYGGNPPSTFLYNSTDHVWFKQRQLSANNNDIEWSVAPAGASPTTPGAWTVQRKLSTEAGWAAHVGGGTPTAFTPVREGIWVRRAGGSGWTPKVDNFNFTTTSAPTPRPLVCWVGP